MSRISWSLFTLLPFIQLRHFSVACNWPYQHHTVFTRVAYTSLFGCIHAVETVGVDDVLHIQHDKKNDAVWYLLSFRYQLAHLRETETNVGDTEIIV